MNHTEVSIEIDSDFTEILTAELAEIGFESFVETDEGLNAYIIADDFREELLNEILAKYQNTTAIACSWQTLERKNWNEEWEKSYEPIEVEDQIRVRASFHEPDNRFTHDLLITPKMSFGTGHHETTWLVMKEQLDLPHEGIDIMDVGCGTGILAILGRKLGAKAIYAFDIDEWAVENTQENFALNSVTENTELLQGTIHNVPSNKQFGGILANINRNILLNEIPRYVQYLLPGGWLVVSGFYTNDQSDIETCAQENGLQVVRSNSRNQWATVVFTKK